MAGHLLFVILIYSFHEMKAQASLPPKLTVNPPVITETDSVTLNCQAPTSVPQCYFRTNGKPAKSFPCMKTLTGTELLKITNQSPPAEVKVTCFYLIAYPSPDSDVSSISIQPSLHPKLTVNPQVITETDSVTLNCQTPPSVSVSQCYFYTLSGGTISVPSCVKTLTGTELLQMAHQSSPAEVKVKCYYTALFGGTYTSHGDSSSITIQRQKPQMSLQHFDGDSVLFTCSLPGSANHDTRCNLYFGEASHPVKTTTIRRETTSTNRMFCRFTVSIDHLLTHLRSVLRKYTSCDYTLGSEPNSFSPRSDKYSLTYIVDKESSKMQTTPTLTMTTGLNVNTPRTSTSLTPTQSTSDWTTGSSTVSSSSTFPTSAKPTSDWTTGSSTVSSSYTFPTSVKPTSDWTTGSSTVSSSSTFPTLVKPTSGADTGMTDKNQGSGDEIIGSSVSKPGTTDSPKTPASGTWIWKIVAVVAGCGVTVGIILLVSVIIWNQRGAGSKELKTREPQNTDSDTHHMYCEISQEPTAIALKDVVYSTVVAH